MEATVNRMVRRTAVMTGIALIAGVGLLAGSTAGAAGAAKASSHGAPAQAKQSCRATKSRPWSFGIEADTQWTVPDDGRNPFTCSVDIARQLDDQFIMKNTKFVVEVGDLVDSGSATNEAARAVFAQDLYNAGIGFYPLSGNHDDGQGAALLADYPQTQSAMMNTTPSSAFGIANPDALQPFPAQTGMPFRVGTISTSPAAPAGFNGLDYAVDYRNARLVFMDQFTSPDSSVPAHEALTSDDVAWMNGQLTGRPAGTQAFVFGHKGIITQNHVDALFGSDPTANPTLQDTFISDLQKAHVHYYIGGHDHMYNRAVDASPDGTSSVQDLVCQSDASKFYIPFGEAGYTQRSVDSAGKVTSTGTLAAADPTQTNDGIYDVQVVKATKLAGFTGTPRETPIAQDLNKVGYYIVTVDGANVTVDYYAAVVNPTNSGGEYLLASTPWLNFVKEETFGYSLTGKEFFVPQGGSYTSVKGAFHGTSAQILGGSNGSSATDVSGRKLTKDVTTGWAFRTCNDVASNVFTLWGLSDVGASSSDIYALSMGYCGWNPHALLVTKTAKGRWVNAVGLDTGGTAKLVVGPWKAGYALGTYGIDKKTKTVWAVVNHTGQFAVAR